MSKELDYIQRQIDIVKQQVKGSKMKIIVTDTVTKHQYDYYERELQTLESIEKALHRLESIDNAEPSEALECLENIEADLTGLPKHVTEYDNIFDDYLYDIEDNIDTIKQALLKEQKEHKALDLLMQELDCKDFAELRKYARCGYEKLKSKEIS